MALDNFFLSKFLVTFLKQISSQKRQRKHILIYFDSGLSIYRKIQVILVFRVIRDPLLQHL